MGGRSQQFTLESCTIETGTKTAENGTYRILSTIQPKKVFEVAYSSQENGANIVMWDNTRSMQQKFEIELTQDNYYHIRSKISNKVLTVESENPRQGSTVTQQEEDQTLDTQKWILKKHAESVYAIVSKCGNLYITLQNTKIQNGQKLQLQKGNDLAPQQFILVNETPKEKITTKVQNGVYQIITKGNRVLDISGGTQNEAANSLIWDNRQAQNQKYEITRIGNTDYYRILAVHSAKSLDVQIGDTNPGANIIQYSYGGTDNQQWLLKESDEPGYYSIISKKSGLYLDVAGGKISTPGANVELWYGNGADAQKFKLNPVNIINNDSYQIANITNGNRVFDVSGSSQDENANVLIWEKNSTINQIFRLESTDHANYKIIARHSNKVLTLTANQNVVQAEDTDQENQKWIIETAGSNFYRIRAKSNGQYLQIKGNNVQVNPLSPSALQIFQFQNLPQKRGIDVSQFNEYINWEFVKRAGVEFAIIRAGYRGYRSGGFAEDKYFKINMEGAKRAGIKIGVYFFSQAVNEAEAVQEANWTVQKIREVGMADQIHYPIIIDTEPSGGNPSGRADGLDVATRTAVCKAFCETVKANGYRAMIYASRDWFYNNLDMKQLNQYDIWVAHYTGSPNKVTNYRNHYEMWQYTSIGEVMGIDGNVDLNISYQNY